MLEVVNLRKTFGSVTAVDDVSFSVPEGTILGMIGQNGAGKTTIFRLILDFLQADHGQVLWQGRPFQKKDYDQIGYLPEERGLYVKDTIEEQLYYFAELRGVRRADIAPKIDEWLERFQVKGKRKDKIKALSKGNQQKVQVIATLLHQPRLVILDEPFSGLDPVNAGLLKEAILSLKQQGASVIFSSHNMENVAELCDHLIMIRNGEKVLDGDVWSVRQSFGRTQITVETPISTEALQAIPGVLSVESGAHHLKHVQLSDEVAGRAVFDLVSQEGYVPLFSQQPPTLEQIFKMKVGEINE